MSQKSFISAPAAVQSRYGASESVLTAGVHDFLLLCKQGNLAEAVHALYYLPKNYKIMIMSDKARASEKDSTWMEGTSLKDRIHFETTETTEERESPYLVAHAVISDDADAETVKSTAEPYIVVSATAGAGITVSGTHGFTVQSGNPEALASAILHLSRQK